MLTMRMKTTIPSLVVYFLSFMLLLSTYEIVHGEIEIKYKPPFLPVFISVNSSGNLSIGGEKSITSFLGTFSIGADYSIYQQEKYTTVVIRNLLKNNEQAYKVYTDGDELTVVADGNTRIEIKDRWILVQVKGSADIRFKTAEKPSPKVNPAPEEIPKHEPAAYIEFTSFWPKKRGEIKYDYSNAGYDWYYTDTPHWRITHIEGYMDFHFKGKKNFFYYALGSASHDVSYCDVILYANGRRITKTHIPTAWKTYSISSEEFTEGDNTARIELVGDTHIWIHKVWVSSKR
jgi:hypothetical protein